MCLEVFLTVRHLHNELERKDIDEYKHPDVRRLESISYKRTI